MISVFKCRLPISASELFCLVGMFPSFLLNLFFVITYCFLFIKYVSHANVFVKIICYVRNSRSVILLNVIGFNFSDLF